MDTNTPDNLHHAWQFFSLFSPLFSQQNVDEWLKTLKMDEYIDIFHSAGYKTGEDVENLKELNKNELKKIGIHKRGMFTCYYSYYKYTSTI